MKIIEMGKLCHACQFYRTISYSTGASSIGCTKAPGSDGRAVDIVHLKKCPLGHGRHKIPILEARDLLPALGKIFAETAPSERHLSLYSILSQHGGNVHRRRKLISIAMQQMGIITVVAKAIPGHRGRHYVYRWDLKKYGAPSLDMADKIIMQVEQLMLADSLSRKRVYSEPEADLKVYKIKVIGGQTKCDKCWLKGLNDCRAQLMSFGIDCKVLNINTIKYEAGLGFAEESGED